jgi:hypothetical protein
MELWRPRLTIGMRLHAGLADQSVKSARRLLGDAEGRRRVVWRDGFPRTICRDGQPGVRHSKTEAHRGFGKNGTHAPLIEPVPHHSIALPCPW